MSAIVQPIVIVTLLALVALSGFLRRLPYYLGAAAVIAIALGVTLALIGVVQHAFAAKRSGPSQRYAVLAVLTTLMLLAYFDLRGPRALARDRRSAAAGAAGAHPPALPVQQHQRGALAHPPGPAARRDRARRPRRSLSRRHGRQPRALADLARGRALPPVPRPRAAAARRAAEGRLAHRQDAARRAGAAARAAAAARERRLSRHRAARGARRDQHRHLSAAQPACTRVLRNPYSREGNHHAGNKMALANIRERLQLHFDAEATARDARRREHVPGAHLAALREGAAHERRRRCAS